MNKLLSLSALIVCAFIGSGCKDGKNSKPPVEGDAARAGNLADTSAAASTGAIRPTADIGGFIPHGYVLMEQIDGDLNNDGQSDYVLLIKGTDKSKFFTDETHKNLDRNRRGIVVVFSKGEKYEAGPKNYDCFSSENEDGGVYYAPELSVEIKKGNLYISYAHGRYGFWSYTFRFQHSDFELIGYDASENRGPVVNTETSVNYLTKTAIIKTNTNEAAEGGDEVFDKKVKHVQIDKLIRLSDVKDFDELDVPKE